MCLVFALTEPSLLYLLESATGTKRLERRRFDIGRAACERPGLWRRFRRQSQGAQGVVDGGRVENASQPQLEWRHAPRRRRCRRLIGRRFGADHAPSGGAPPDAAPSAFCARLRRAGPANARADSSFRQKGATVFLFDVQ